VVLASR